MKFIVLLIAAAAAVKMDAAPSSSPIYPEYFDDMNAKADDMHAATMKAANKRLVNQKNGVADSYNEIQGYKASVGCSTD